MSASSNMTFSQIVPSLELAQDSTVRNSSLHQSHHTNSDNSDISDKEDFIELLTMESKRPINHRPPIKIKLTDSTSLGYNSNQGKNSLSSYKSVIY